VHTARYAVRPDGVRDFAWAMRRLEADVGDAADRSAWFTCALAVAWPEGPVVAVEGISPGSVSFPARGTNGHGYDPVFVPEGKALTFAELDPAEKDKVSHRGRAFLALKAALF
jgi:XTP/dITP diphosphohydrolase